MTQSAFSTTACPSCGAMVSIHTSGTGFCSTCGAHAAIVPPPAEGWDVAGRAVGQPALAAGSGVRSTSPASGAGAHLPTMAHAAVEAPAPVAAAAAVAPVGALAPGGGQGRVSASMGLQGPPPMPEGMEPAARPELQPVPEPERATHSYIVESRRGGAVGSGARSVASRRTNNGLLIALASIGLVIVAVSVVVGLV